MTFSPHNAYIIHIITQFMNFYEWKYFTVITMSIYDFDHKHLFLYVWTSWLDIFITHMLVLNICGSESKSSSFANDIIHWFQIHGMHSNDKVRSALGELVVITLPNPTRFKWFPTKLHNSQKGLKRMNFHSNENPSYHGVQRWQNIFLLIIISLELGQPRINLVHKQNSKMNIN